MRKFLITMMCIIMVVCFMPTVALADGESLPKGPDMSGTVVNVNAANAQYTLDGAYGSIDGKTINFTESINTVLHIGRPTKYECSNTEYFVGGYSGDQSEKFDTAADLCKYKAQTGYTKYCYYSRTMSNVTFTSEENVTLEGFDMANATGHVYEGNYDFVRDKQLTNGTNDGYYGNINITGLTFDGLSIKHTDVNDAYAIDFYITSVSKPNVLSDITFKNCKITDTASGIARFMNNGGKLDTYNNITFEKCDMSVSSKEENRYGVLVLGTGNLTVKDCRLKGMTRAVQTQSGGADSNNQNEYGKLVVSGNEFDDIQTYIIKVANTADITGLTVSGNRSTNSAADCEVRIEPDAYAGKGEIVIQENNWDNNVNYKYEWNKDKITVAEVNNVKYSSLEDAITAATPGQTVKLMKNVTISSGIKIETDKNIILDLNGHTLSSLGGYVFNVYGKLELNNGTVELKSGDNGAAIWLRNTASVVVNNEAKIVTKESTNNPCFAVAIWSDCTTAEFILKGAIEGENGVTINGNIADIGNIVSIKDGATINVSGTGLYLAGNGNTTVTNATITGNTGVEIRAGELTVNGGNINGGNTFSCIGNAGGTTTDGAGIAVVQHTTKLPIDVKVTNGNISGAKAIYKGDPQNNGEEAMRSVIVSVTGGTFSTDPKEYVASGYTVDGSGPYTVKAVSSGIPSISTTPTDNVTNSGTSGTDNATTSADLSNTTSTSNGTTAATVDKTTADKIVDKAVENKSTEVVIDATANSTTAADSTTTAQVTIPTETLGAIAEKTEADVTIKTDVAEVKMDNAAAAAVSEQAEGDTVKIIAEKVKEDATEVHFELKVVCSDGKVISNFNGGNIAVTVALPKAMAEKKVVCVYIDDNGHMSKVEGQKNADGTYTFFTGHFSTYAILAEEEADAVIAEQTEAIKNIEIKVSTKLDATKAGKKGIKVTWKTADGKKLDGVEFFRSVKKNSGYGKKAFFTSKKAGTTGYYLNTKSLKKGTRYYYRVRGYVLVDGQKVYTDWSNKGIRTFR